MIYLALFVFITFLILAVLCEATGKIIVRSSQKIILISICVSLSIAAWYIIPKPGMDLYRYYKMIDRFRMLDIDVAREEVVRNFQPLFAVECLLISRTPYNMLAPLISCATVFSIYSYIYFDYKKYNNVNERELIFSFGLLFAWTPYFQIIDNLRSPMAMAVCALCIYKQYYHSVSLKSLLPYYIVASLIHWQAVAVLAFVAIYKFFPNVYKFRFLLLTTGLFYAAIAFVIGLLPGNFFAVLAARIISYFTGVQYLNRALYNEYTVSRFVIVLLFVIFLEKAIRNYKREHDDCRFAELFELILLFSLGCASVAEIIRRFCYLGGFFAVIESDICTKYSGKIARFCFRLFVWVIILGMQFWALLKMDRFEITGVDYSGLMDYLRTFIAF